MTAIYKLLRAFAPLVLVVFISSVITAPVQGQAGDVYQEYQVSTPSKVCRGDIFELTLTSEKEVLDHKAVTLILPAEFANALPSPVILSDRSLVYKIKAGPDLGDKTILIKINSSAGSTTLSQKINVQQTYLEMAQPFLIAAGVIAVIVLFTRGM